MPNIEGQKRWSSVRLLETQELARGGVNGNLNEQAQALADRTELLMDEKASKEEIVQGVFEFATYTDFNTAKSTLPLNCTVVIGEENTSGTGTWEAGNNRWNGSNLIKSAYDPVMKSALLIKEESKKNNILTEQKNVMSLSVQKGNSKDIFSNSFKTIGYALDLNGIEVMSPNWSVTGFIPVKFDDVVRIYTRANTNFPNIVAYKRDRTFHSILFTGTSSGSTFHMRDLTVPSGAAFIRMAYITASESESFIKITRDKTPNNSIDTEYIFNALFKQKNLYVAATASVDKYLVKNEQRDSPGWSHTDYIPVNELCSYVTSGNGISAGLTVDSFNLGVHFYDADKNLIDVGSRLQPNISFKTPNGCKFIRLNFINASSSNFTVAIGDSFHIDFLGSTILNKLIEHGALNEYDPIAAFGVNTGYFVDTTGVLKMSPNWSTTNYIPVEYGAVLTYSCQSNSTVIMASMYDENNIYIGVLAKASSGSLGIISGISVIPDGCRFIKLCFYNLENRTFKLSKKKESTTTPGESASNISRYNGKTWLAMGTSIVDSQSTAYTYPKWVTEYFGFTLYDHAVSGTRVRSCLQRATASIDARILDSEFITIDHGTNDFKIETVMGTIDDAPTSAAYLKDPVYRANGSILGTFYGDLKGVIEYIYSVKPSARIYLITPIRRSQPAATGTDTNSLGLKLVDYRNAVVEIAKFYGLPLLDNYYESGFNTKTIPAWTSDGLHPNEWAQKNVLANKVIGFIESN